MFTIAYVTDNTPESLEYGDYRGHVVLDKNGYAVAKCDSDTQAREVIAAKTGRRVEDLRFVRGYSEEYGTPLGVWDLQED